MIKEWTYACTMQVMSRKNPIQEFFSEEARINPILHEEYTIILQPPLSMSSPIQRVNFNPCVCYREAIQFVLQLKLRPSLASVSHNHVSHLPSQEDMELFRLLPQEK